MAPKSTSKTKKRKPLTATEYLLFNDMISRIRALEHVATERFMNGKSGRIKMAKALGGKVDRLQKSFFARGRCPVGYCKSDGVCYQCDSDDRLRELLGSLIN